MEEYLELSIVPKNEFQNPYDVDMGKNGSYLSEPTAKGLFCIEKRSGEMHAIKNKRIIGLFLTDMT